MTTIASSAAITNEIGRMSWPAAADAATSTTSPDSVAYATEESGSEAKTGSASFFERRVSSISPVALGRPTRRRFTRSKRSARSAGAAGPGLSSVVFAIAASRFDAKLCEARRFALRGREFSDRLKPVSPTTRGVSSGGERDHWSNAIECASLAPPAHGGGCKPGCGRARNRGDLRAPARRAGSQPWRALSVRRSAGGGAVGTPARAAGLDREHARVQLVLPSADAHVPARRLGELGRARRLPRDRGQRQRPRRPRPAPRGGSRAATARGDPCRGAAAQRGDRGRGAAAKRRGEDGGAALRQPRSPLADHGDQDRQRGARGPG